MSMKFTNPLFFAVALVVCQPAFSQWVWLNERGEKVFSDRAPGIEVPAKNILKQPSATTPKSPPPQPPAQTPGATAKPVIVVDQSLEAKKKQADDAAAAKQKQEQEANKQIKADNCARAKQSKSLIDSGRRVAKVQANGEVGYMDDQERAAEQARAQSIIDKECQP